MENKKEQTKNLIYNCRSSFNGEFEVEFSTKKQKQQQEEERFRNRN